MRVSESDPVLFKTKGPKQMKNKQMMQNELCTSRLPIFTDAGSVHRQNIPLFFESKGGRGGGRKLSFPVKRKFPSPPHSQPLLS